MALTNPKIPYKTIRDSLRDLFRNNMASLNTNLAAGTFTADEQIKTGNPEIENTPITLYPVMFIQIISKAEEFRSLGHSGRKIPELTFRIYGAISDMSTNREDEIIYLASNMEGLLRDNIQFDSNVLWSNPTNTNFGLGEFEPSVYVNVVAIDLICNLEVK